MARGESALELDKKGMFRFNAGMEQKTMPDYNPYTIKRCKDCNIAKGKLKLAKILFLTMNSARHASSSVFVKRIRDALMISYMAID